MADRSRSGLQSYYILGFYDKILLIGDYKTTPLGLYFGIFESLVLMP